METVALISGYLETYEGRDKFLRTLSYAAKLVSGYAKTTSGHGPTSGNLKKLGSELSKCRVILRLLDDFGAIRAAVEHDWSGKTKNDWMVRWAETIQVIVDLVYCPVEHISWFGELKLLKINVGAWDNATTWFWLISICLSLVRSIRKCKQLGIDIQHESRSRLENTEPLLKERQTQLLTCGRLLLDMSYAIAYLPPGILWGGKFQTWQIGALGTISSLIGLHQALEKRRIRLKSQ